MYYLHLKPDIALNNNNNNNNEIYYNPSLKSISKQLMLNTHTYFI